MSDHQSSNYDPNPTQLRKFNPTIH